MPKAFRQIAVLATILLISGCSADARGAPDSFAPLVKKVLPTVVNIAVTEAAPNRDLLRDLPPELRDTPLGREFRRRFGDRQERTPALGRASSSTARASSSPTTTSSVTRKKSLFP